MKTLTYREVSYAIKLYKRMYSWLDPFSFGTWLKLWYRRRKLLRIKSDIIRDLSKENRDEKNN